MTRFQWVLSAMLCVLLVACNQVAEDASNVSNPPGTVLDLIQTGMSEDEVDELLQPKAMASAKMHLGGSGAYIKYYQLGEDTQLAVHFGGAASAFKVDHFGPIEPKSKWSGLSFALGNEEASRATDIAAAHLNALIADGVVLDDKFKISPAGRPVSPELPQMTVEIDGKDKGEMKRYTVTASGRYVTHRIVELDFMSNGHWEHRVAVDMDDGVVVPTSWEPTLHDIEKARAIADPELADFLGSTVDDRSAVKVRGWGDYDYGPTRRLVVLVYTKPSGPKGFGQELKYARVDIDNGVFCR